MITQLQQHINGIDYQISIYSQNAVVASRIGFDYDDATGEWHDNNGNLTTEANAGFCAFFNGKVEYGDLTSTEMRQGWQDAHGMECYQSEMMREESEAARFAWMA